MLPDLKSRLVQLLLVQVMGLSSPQLSFRASVLFVAELEAGLQKL